MKIRLLVKDIKIRTLVSGDKQGRVTLETLWPNDVKKLGELSETMEIDVHFDQEGKLSLPEEEG